MSVRGEYRERPDVAKIARAVISMAMAQAEADAAAQAAQETAGPKPDCVQSDAGGDGHAE